MKTNCGFLWLYAINDNIATLLLQHRSDGLFGTAGGKIEKNETIVEGLKRELYEEINYVPRTDIKELGVYQKPLYQIYSFYSEVSIETLHEIQMTYRSAELHTETFGISLVDLSTELVRERLVSYPFAGSGTEELTSLLKIIDKRLQEVV